MTAVERTLHLTTPHGSMETFIAHPTGGGKFAPVILYMDMWGMRRVMTEIARRVAGAGYFCVLPDVYYRQGKIRYAPMEMPGPLSFMDLEPDRRVALRAAMDNLADDVVMDDTRFLLHYITRNEPVRAGAAGVIGYCMGGRHAVCAAGTFADTIRATACLHGTDLIKSGGRSPHALLAQRAQGEIYFGHAERDKYAPTDVVQRLDEALAGRQFKYERQLHAGAEHGYAVPDRDVYDAKATDQDWRMIFAMFDRQLSAKEE